MTAHSPVATNAPIPARPIRRERADHEFLPAALEILETPQSPIKIAMIWTICLLATAGLGWGYFGRLDVVAAAQGKIQPAGRIKVIQPLETGRVASVAVENGQRVLKGQTLVTFESGETTADVAELEADLAAYLAESARRRTAVAALDDRVIEPIPPIAWPDGVPEAIRDREAKVLVGDLGKLASTVAGLESQASQKRREGERYTAQAAVLKSLVATLQVRVDMRTSLEKLGSGSKAEVINATETLQEQKAVLATALGQIAESAAAAETLTRQIEDGYRSFLAENLQKLAEAERRVDEDRQKLAKARLRHDRMVLTSPIDGAVSALSITTVGQVVGAGEEVMRIVPDDSAGVEIEAYLPNRDIGFVSEGQTAVVKIESLPFTRYGTVDATLTKIAKDAIPEPEAGQREGDPSRSARERGLAGAQRTQNLVFPVTLRLQATSVMADGARVPLSPGMAVTVEIKTGERRILDYLFAPLAEVASASMRER